MEVQVFAIRDKVSGKLLNTSGNDFLGSKTSPVRWFGRKSDAVQSYPYRTDSRRYEVVSYTVNI